MPKMSIDPPRHSLNGATMGTRWSLRLPAAAAADCDRDALQDACQAAVTTVDRQMSTWTPTSDLMRFNAAAPGDWHALPAELMTVLHEALTVGRASGGAFEIAMGDAVRAWGFGPLPADAEAIKAAMRLPRRPSFETLELDLAAGRARKHAPMQLDLCGIAKGYGVDRLIAVAQSFGLCDALAAIDGELRAIGTPGGPLQDLPPDPAQARPLNDRRGWTVALEQPDPGRRAIHSMFELKDVAIATSGDYRHRISLGGRHLAHTMDPWRGAPLLQAPASVTVLADSCMRADALASACMVLGATRGADFAARMGAEVIFLDRPSTAAQAS